MDDLNRQYRKQWGQLIVLTAVHFVMDAFPGLMHTVLPAFQASFHLSVAAGGILLTAFLVSTNGIQVVIGHLRPERERPLFLYAGIVLACSILLFRFVSSEAMPLLWLSLISVLCGAGIGMTHPEALKAVHRLDRISSAVSSSIFMAGGVIGFAVGGWGSTYLFKAQGVGALTPFCIASLVTLGLTLAFGIRLAVEREEAARRTAGVAEESLSFWLIMTIATLSACSVQILMWIIPQRLSEIGSDLTVGGLAVSLFSVAGGIGGMVLARTASRLGEIKLIEWMLAIGAPFTVAYLILMRHTWAVWLLFVGGFFCYGAYPLMISAARHSKGPSLGRRMGLIVGGIWLIACVLPMLLGPAAHRFGTGPILFCVPVGFVLAWAMAMMSGKKKPPISQMAQKINV
jgi:MFS family permease